MNKIRSLNKKDSLAGPNPCWEEARGRRGGIADDERSDDIESWELLCAPFLKCGGLQYYHHLYLDL